MRRQSLTYDLPGVSDTRKEEENDILCRTLGKKIPLSPSSSSERGKAAKQAREICLFSLSPKAAPPSLERGTNTEKEEGGLFTSWHTLEKD